MNKVLKISLGVIGLVMVTGVLTSCNSFCSLEDSAHYYYAYDPINTRYFENVDQGKNYILGEFSKLDSLKDQKQPTFEDLTFYKEGSLVKVEEDNVFGTFGQTKYLKPNKLYYTTKTTGDDGKETTVNNVVTLGFSSFTTSLIASAESQGMYVPTFSYWEKLDEMTMELMIKTSSDMSNEYQWLSGISSENVTFQNIYGYTYNEYKDYTDDPTDEKLDELLGKPSEEDEGVPAKKEGSFGRNYSLLTTYGYKKHYTEKGETVDNWAFLEETNKTISSEIGLDQAMSSSFLNLYKTNLNQKVATIKTCITVNDGFYGHTSDNLLDDTVRISAKAPNFWVGWGNAFSQHGFFEGLFVYPIAIAVENFSHAFGMNGWGQIFAVLLITVIIRLLFMLITLPSTLSQQKMQYLQPEISRLQQKYPNYNTNQYEKQKFSQEQMNLYKKHKIHPFSSILVMIVQFPVFICVWNAMTGSASLSSDAVMGLRLSDTIWNVLSNINGWPNNPGRWTALVLILVMSGSQIISMLLPNWLNKSRMKKISKTGVNPAQTSQQKQMKWVQWIMTAFIVVMGFTLPSAMGVYWFAGAIFAIIQTLIMHLILIRTKGGIK